MKMVLQFPVRICELPIRTCISSDTVVTKNFMQFSFLSVEKFYLYIIAISPFKF